MSRSSNPRVTADRSVIVVGGGLAGMSAATVLAERGVQVTVVEREPYLGGRLGAWSDTLTDGTTIQMDRGFHGFFRQYYNLRSLLRRVDPTLAFLTPLADYPLLGPQGEHQSFARLPRMTPLNVAALIHRSPHVRWKDLLRADGRAALSMFSFDSERTYARWDEVPAADYLDSLGLPGKARRMLFDVFSHSFFNPEESFSAAEMLMYFHFYFTGNPEGLVFDVANASFSTCIWEPLREYLTERGVTFCLDSPVRAVHSDGNTVVVDAGERRFDGDGCVLATPVAALQRIVRASESLGTRGWRVQVGDLARTNPFAVWRLWTATPSAPGRRPFVGTTGIGWLDNISVYDRFDRESAEWAQRTGGSVIELHAYALPEEVTEAAVKEDLWRGLVRLYPEHRDASVVDDRFSMGRDCPAFLPGSWADAPGVETPNPTVVLAGDFIRTAFPSALMERATATGMLAANHFLRRWSMREEPLQSVPIRGALAPVCSLADRAWSSWRPATSVPRVRS